MKRISINMLSQAESKPGQGVGSAYVEQVNLVKEGACDVFDIKVNSLKNSDIIHYHTVNLGNYFSMKTTKSIKVSYVHFLPETLDGSIKLPKFAFNAFKDYVIDFYKSSNYLVVVNPIFIKELAKYKIDPKKIVYIPNYVSKKEFFSQKPSIIMKTRKKLGISSDAFVVLGVGQVQTRKGVLDFIDVAKKMPEVTFVWCGGFSFGKITDGYKELKKVCDNPPANVKFVGIVPRTEMNDMYNMANVLFMPSYNELFPMSILEAVNCHKPILLRDLDLYEDILFKKYLKGHDNDDFIRELKRLINDKELYSQCSLASGEISNFYSKENVLDLWKKFYTDIYNKGAIKRAKKTSLF